LFACQIPVNFGRVQTSSGIRSYSLGSKEA